MIDPASQRSYLRQRCFVRLLSLITLLNCLVQLLLHSRLANPQAIGRNRQGDDSQHEWQDDPNRGVRSSRRHAGPFSTVTAIARCANASSARNGTTKTV